MTHKIKLILLFCAFLFPNRVLLAQQSPVARIKVILKAQADAWNKGDIPGYMKPYKISKKTTFITDHTVLSGYNKMYWLNLDRYKDTLKMGHLEIKVFGSQPIDSNHVYIIGQKTKTFSNGRSRFNFAQLWKKENGRWVIISDFTPY